MGIIKSLRKRKKMKKIIMGLDKLDQRVKYEVNYNYYEKKALTADEYGLNEKEEREEKIIISLTTYSKRIYDVFLVIETIFSQTVKPDKIILWLAKDEFNDDNIPLVLKNMKKRGLEIEYCRDIKSYKKIIPTLKLYPKDIIITIDDDVFYPFDFIEKLYSEHLKDRESIIFYRGHRIMFKNTGEILPYREWEFKTNFIEKSIDLLPTGVGGVLYPSNSFDKEVFNENKFMSLAPRGDDIWLKAMTLKNGRKCKKVDDVRNFEDRFLEIKSSQDIALWSKNLRKNQNDIQIKAVFDEYDLWKYFKK